MSPQLLRQEVFDAKTAERRIKELDAALATAHGEIGELRLRLHALETSTIWRMTGPVRFALGGMRRWRQTHANRRRATLPALTAIDRQHYESWIRTSEAACRVGVVPPGPALYPKTMGLVVWCSPNSAPDLASMANTRPASCRVLVLNQGAALKPEPGIEIVAVPSDAEPAAWVRYGLERLNADLIGFLDGRDRLAPDALRLVAETAARCAELDLLFADEDWLDAQGRRTQPFFKPGWDAELQRGRDLVGPFAFYRAALVGEAAPVTGPAWLYDLANQVAAAAQPQAIHHIPAVLCHRTFLPPGHAEACRAVAAQHLRKEGVAADIVPIADLPGCNRIVRKLPDPAPTVSIIIPTRDRADLLRVCCESVLQRTEYPRLEILIVDNGSTEPDALALLDRLTADPRVRMLRQPGPFNWSALNNVAAAEATGSILVLMNNDIAVLTPDWLSVLVAHAVQPGVGAVGAKLLYPDGRVQHAGLTTDLSGIPRHLFRYLDGRVPGAFGMARMAREVWGITGACMAVPRHVFTELGGLNEAFPVAYNDVEFCLRLTARGYRIIWTPWSYLEHYESASRPSDLAEGRREQVMCELDRLKRDWGSQILHDRYFNANLHLVDEQPHFREILPSLPGV